MLDLNGPLITSSRESKQACYPHGFNGSCSHTPSHESRIKIICKTASVYTNSSTTFAVAWTFSSETITDATLDAASQTGASSKGDQ
ncbi:hypothetical protein TNCV_1251121 [Trichonephila clavipes]|nr:hypothetical protein TNCV_2802571 [Trichonephila clavipes]GFU44762.1 hypothetical protein TNCV_1251121 [Trichonephila clavipes]